MKRLLAIVVVLVVFGSAGSARAETGILIPAYFSPSQTAAWDQVKTAAARVKVSAIINPSNGPGTSRNASYAALVTSANNSGVIMIGYVFTSYGARSVAGVKADVDKYFSWYPEIKGIFFDEAQNTAGTGNAYINYYKDIRDYVKSKTSGNPMVIINPGGNTVEAYIKNPGGPTVEGWTTDVICTYESANYPGYSPSSWHANYPMSSYFYHLPYKVPDAATMRSYLALAVQRNAGWVYFTDDDLPNPWDSLPSYWTAEVDAVAALSDGKPHPPSQLRFR